MLLNEMQMKRRGFTLIELLVVISIIAILSAVGLSSFQNSQRRARDAARRSDLTQIRNAMEQYYVTNNAYVGAYTALPVTAWSSAAAPKDPRANANYPQTVSSATAYTVCADLELTAAGAIDATWTGSNADECVSNLQ